MDKKYAIHNPEETKEHLEALINELKATKNLSALEEELLATFQEIYWHLNKVWNGRKTDQKIINQLNDEEFDNLCKFPNDLNL